jgi:hypothetical protein
MQIIQIINANNNQPTCTGDLKLVLEYLKNNGSLNLSKDFITNLNTLSEDMLTRLRFKRDYAKVMCDAYSLITQNRLKNGLIDIKINGFILYLPDNKNMQYQVIIKEC